MTYAKIKMPGVQTRLNDQEEQALIDVLRKANSLATSTEGEAFEKEFLPVQWIGRRRGRVELFVSVGIIGHSQRPRTP